jgi:DMSO/TMAO reductase YedYZ heme-binding membrane subunit
MEAKAAALAALGAAALAVFAGLSYLVKDTAIIWIEARFLGLASYLCLFLAVSAGEWRILTKGKSQFPLFRYHKTVSISAVVLTSAHFIASFLDNYKWGPQLTAYQYFGLSFSDQWLAYLSLGTLAFYLMVAVAATSGTGTIRFIGFSRWKLVHYLGYAAFYMGYIHAVNLGTDIKSSFLAGLLSPMMGISLSIVSGLLITRVLEGRLKYLSDRAEVGLAAGFFTILCLLTLTLYRTI